LSFHEKRNRFFTVSLVALLSVVFTVILWFANRSRF